MRLLGEKIRAVLKRVPGAAPTYARAQTLYFSTAETLGFVPDKESLVSRDYWNRRAIKLWEQDRVPDATYQEATIEMIAELKKLSWSNLLEVGCGHGRVLKEIAQAIPGKSLSGGDFSDNQLAHARDYLKGFNVNLLQMDARQLPFPDGHFDVILTAGSLIYLRPEELAVTLREFYRVSKQYLVLSEYALDHLTSAAHKRISRGTPFYMHDYRAALAQQGFAILESGLLKAWQNQPERLPQTLIIAQRSLPR